MSVHVSIVGNSLEKMFNDDQRQRLHSRSHYLIALRQLVDEEKILVEYTDGRNHKASVLIIPTCNLTFK